MKILLRAALPIVLLLSGTATAIEIEAGGRTIEIPIPAGYAELTPAMSPMYEAMYAYVVPTNERYLILVPAEAAESFLRGEDADYERYMMIEAERQTVRANITQTDFDQFRGMMRDQLEELHETVRRNLPDMFDNASNSMSQALDADLELSVGEIVPFEPHLDSDRAFAYSQLISMGVAVDGEDLGADVGMATATFLNVNGKLIFVYVYGGEDDLEWSREFASDWADQILAANAAAEETLNTVVNVGTFRDSAYAQDVADDEWPLSLTLIIAIAIGALALVFVARRRSRRGSR